ncbi:hypothetical protein PVAP13_3KG161000 [Panicum virgatum]|uniref:Secreted protein n=1 Tax=Panicum virgatum TaxID=38727 RepID=A0A8T0UY88_PANVG|nr:hypothetical protein PVAP13_3KG161000 [Panicum virgatum]
MLWATASAAATALAPPTASLPPPSAPHQDCVALEFGGARARCCSHGWRHCRTHWLPWPCAACSRRAEESCGGGGRLRWTKTGEPLPQQLSRWCATRDETVLPGLPMWMWCQNVPLDWRHQKYLKFFLHHPPSVRWYKFLPDPSQQGHGTRVPDAEKRRQDNFLQAPAPGPTPSPSSPTRRLPGRLVLANNTSTPHPLNTSSTASPSPT